VEIARHLIESSAMEAAVADADEKAYPGLRVPRCNNERAMNGHRLRREFYRMNC